MLERGGTSAERLGPLDPSLVLPLSYALSRPFLASALVSDPSVFPAACVAAAALRRLERSALRSLSLSLPGTASTWAARMLRWLVACALQLAGAAVLWTMAEWGSRLAAPHVASSMASMTLQSYFGLLAASLTALAFALPPRKPGHTTALFSRALAAMSLGMRERRRAAAAASSTDSSDTPPAVHEGKVSTPAGRRPAAMLASPLMSPQKLLDGGGDRRDVVVYNERFGFRRKLLLPVLNALPFNIGDGILAVLHEVATPLPNPSFALTPSAIDASSRHSAGRPAMHRHRTHSTLQHSTDDMTMAALDAKNSELALLARRNAALQAACSACLDLLDEAMTNHELHRSTRPDSDQEGALEMRAWEACRKARRKLQAATEREHPVGLPLHPASPGPSSPIPTRPWRHDTPAGDHGGVPAALPGGLPDVSYSGSWTKATGANNVHAKLYAQRPVY